MKSILIGAMIALALSPLAQAKNGIYPVRSPEQLQALKNLRLTAGAGKLLYYGGPVIAHPNVVAVMWGPNVVNDVKTGIGAFFSASTKSDMMDWMDQYNTAGKSQDGRDGTNQHIGKGTFGGTITITPTITGNRVDDRDIQTELQRQIDSGKLPKADDNTLYMVYFPPGITITIDGMTSCSQFCAYHMAKGDPLTPHFFYGVMPDLGGACSFGCGFGNHFDTATAITAHEFCEATTDPFPTAGSTPSFPQAWNDTGGNEVGDLCAGENNTLRAGSKNFTVQSEWDNAAGACTSRTWTAQ